MRLLLLATPLLLAACQTENTSGAPGTSPDGFTGIAEGETIRFLGTEPFWGGTVKYDRLTYDTPENPEGETFPVKRFTGQGGLGFSGSLDSASFDMTVTPGDCSDGMSDRTYPFTVTLKIGEETRNGCAWTDAQPFDGPLTP
ncbi:COG3650 family protein [Alteriqipengyuania sp.]|uniref:COG3650 family protein n=1 Tax=Alteriqipengyuania sp. TaxID=2800692 RepID=UPI0035147B6B